MPDIGIYKGTSITKESEDMSELTPVEIKDLTRLLRLCNYHEDGLGGDECSDNPGDPSAWCEVDRARSAVAREKKRRRNRMTGTNFST